MTDSSTVVEGTVKYRDGKKWKPRWCVVRKLSPVADCLTLQFYRDSKEKCKNGPTKSSLSLEKFLGMETGFTLDKESNTIALVCSDLVILLAFDSRELLIQWQVKIRNNVVEVQQYLVQISFIPAKSKLPTGPARLHLRDYNFSLVASIPPRLLGSWQLEDLRRYGVVEGKFCFEGGSKCGRDEGLHVLLSNQATDISKAFDLASKGRLPGKRRPVSRAIDVSYGHRSSFKNLEVGSSRESERPLLWNCDATSTFDGCSVVGDDYLQQCCGSHQNMFLSPQSRDSVAMSADFASTRTSCVALSEISDKVGDGSGVESSSRVHPYLVDRRLIVDRCPSCLGLTVGGSHTSDDFLDIGEDATSTHTIIPSARKSSDRDSIASGGSSSSSSEYNVPPNVESIYDRPKRFSHLSERCSCMNKGLSVSPNSPLKSPLNRAMTHFQYPDPDTLAFSKFRQPCPCGRRPLQTNTAISNENLSVIHRCAQRCICGGNKSDSLDRQPKLKRRLDHLISGRSSSPCGMRTPMNVANKRQDLCPVVKKCETVIHNAGGVTTTVVRSPINNQLPHHGGARFQNTPTTCTCNNGCQLIGPYGNYDIPPSAVSNKDANKGMKALSCRNQSSQLYDVPKQLQLSEAKAAPQTKDSRVKTVNESICDDDKLWRQQHVCPCQKMLLWAENWLPCRRKDIGQLEDSIPICSSLGGKIGSLKRLPKTKCSCQLRNNNAQGEINDRRETRHRHPKDDSSGSEQSRVSVNSRESGYQSSESKETDNDSDIAKDVSREMENYANIDFVDSLPLYENTNNVLARAGITSGESDEKPALPSKSPGLSKKRLPPLPPSSSMCVKAPANISSVCGSCFQPGENGPRKVPNGSIDTADDDDNENYLEMQPIMLEGTLEGSTYSGEYLTMCDIHEPLPLRPFMPYELTQKPPLEFVDRISSEDSERNRTGSVSSSPMLNKRILQRLHTKTTRSNSLAEIKRNTLPKKRSTSVDSLDDHRSSEDEQDQCDVKKRSPTRKSSIFSKFGLRTKHKCKSSDELSPPSEQCDRPTLVKRTHYSVEFLNIGEEEPCVTADDEDPGRCRTIRRHNSVKYPVTIKRSSSVPNKPALMEAVSSPSDSGISTSFGQHFNENYIEMQRHQSLPKSFNKGRSMCHRRRCPTDDGDLPTQQEIDNVNSTDFPKLQDNQKTCDDKSSSSTTSDMSDYIETLSMSSHSSSETQSIRGDAEVPTTKNRPRTGKDYHIIDRTILQQGSIDKTQHSDLEDRSPRLKNRNSHNSDGSHFVFPKETKEINYLEVDPESLENGPKSPAINPDCATQYAIIDVVATKAANRIGDERERQRKCSIGSSVVPQSPKSKN